MMDASLSLGLDDSMMRNVLPALSLDPSLTGFGDFSFPAFGGDSRGGVGGLEVSFGSSRPVDKGDGKGSREVNFASFNAELARDDSKQGEYLRTFLRDQPQVAVTTQDRVLESSASSEALENEGGGAQERNGDEGVQQCVQLHGAFSHLGQNDNSGGETAGKKRPRKERVSPVVEVKQSAVDHSAKKMWSEEDVERLYVGIERHGTDFQAVSQYVKSKRYDQVKRQFRKEFAKIQQHYRNDGMIVPAQKGANANFEEQVALFQQWLSDQRTESQPEARPASEDAPSKVREPRKKTSRKHRVQLVPDSDADAALLRGSGFNPLIVVVLRGHRPMSDISGHLSSKWGSILVRGTSLQVLGDFTSESTIDQVFESLGTPEVFRLQYRLQHAPSPIAGESTLSNLFGNSITFGGVQFPTSDAQEDVIFPSEDANDGMKDPVVGATSPPPALGSFSGIFNSRSNS